MMSPSKVLWFADCRRALRSNLRKEERTAAKRKTGRELEAEDPGAENDDEFFQPGQSTGWEYRIQTLDGNLEVARCV